MTGWQSKKAMTADKFYAPYVPVLFETWQENLRMWERDSITKYLGRVAPGDDIISDCMDLMQERYPGKYKLEWQNTAPNEYHLVPVFDDDKHETIFKIKYV